MTARIPRLLVFCCAGALPLLACAPRGDVAAKRTTATNPPAIAAAQRISLDGAAEPAPADPATLNNEPAALAARAVDEVHLPDGTVGVRVDKRYYHTITVCRQADGSFSSHCPPGRVGTRP